MAVITTHCSGSLPDAASTPHEMSTGSVGSSGTKPTRNTSPNAAATLSGTLMSTVIIVDSIGYSIGRKGGKPLFEWLGRKFPKHFGPSHLATAERAFQKWGMWAVFFGRFIALLRIFAGPLAGALKMRYSRFLTANAL